MNLVFKRILCFSAVAALLLTGVAITKEKDDAFTADRHKNRQITCNACHGEAQPKTAASEKSCLACHKSIEAVAERTKDFERNPHKNHITEGSDVECTQCHQGHKADTPVCHQCHQGMKFEKKQTATQ
jgi:fumarate reductase flavoprotein subunit